MTRSKHGQPTFILRMDPDPKTGSPTIISEKTGVKHMTKETLLPTAPSATTESPAQSGVKRRSFLKGLGMAGAALSGGSLLATLAETEAHAQSPKSLTAG